MHNYECTDIGPLQCCILPEHSEVTEYYSGNTSSDQSLAERSFTTLPRLKTWLQSTMVNERLALLALLHIHRDISVSAEVVDCVCKARSYSEL